jgi:hypothetical protein
MPVPWSCRTCRRGHACVRVCVCVCVCVCVRVCEGVLSRVNASHARTKGAHNRAWRNFHAREKDLAFCASSHPHGTHKSGSGSTGHALVCGVKELHCCILDELVRSKLVSFRQLSHNRLALLTRVQHCHQKWQTLQSCAPPKEAKQRKGLSVSSEIS